MASTSRGVPFSDCVRRPDAGSKQIGGINLPHGDASATMCQRIGKKKARRMAKYFPLQSAKDCENDADGHFTGDTAAIQLP